MGKRRTKRRAKQRRQFERGVIRRVRARARKVLLSLEENRVPVTWAIAKRPVEPKTLPEGVTMETYYGSFTVSGRTMRKLRRTQVSYASFVEECMRKQLEENNVA